MGVGGVKDGFHVLLRLLGLPAHHGDLLPILNGEVLGHATLTVLGRGDEHALLEVRLQQIPSALEEVLGVVVIRGTGEQLDIERAGGAILKLELVNEPRGLEHADLLQLEGGVVVDGVGVHDQSIVGDDLGACIAGLLNGGAHCGALLGGDHDDLGVVVDHVLDVSVLLGRLIVGERQDDLVSGLLQLGLQVVAVLVPTLFGLGRHRNADSGTLFDLGITASCLAATAATTGREARAHGNACHHGDLLSELHLFSFIFEGMANPPWSPEPGNNLRFIS